MSKKKLKSEDAFENYLVYGIHLHNRRLYFGSSLSGDSEDGNDHFSYDSVQLAIRAIDLMVEMSSKPIEIHMQSYGGDPYMMLALKDKILESGVQFKFYGRGRISSAATWIMAVCDERYLAEDTTVMVHNGGTWHQGGEIKMTDASIDAREDERLQDRLNEIFAENSRMPKSFWDMIVKRDCFLTAQETVELGLADDIIPHRKRASLRKKRMEHLSNHPKPLQIQKLVNRLKNRIGLGSDMNFVFQMPKDQHEELPKYDNTEAELHKLEQDESIVRQD